MQSACFSKRKKRALFFDGFDQDLDYLEMEGRAAGPECVSTIYTWYPVCCYCIAATRSRILTNPIVVSDNLFFWRLVQDVGFAKRALILVCSQDRKTFAMVHMPA